MQAQQSGDSSSAAAPYPLIPLPWIREDGSRCHCYPLTVPTVDGRDGERRVFVYCAPGRHDREVVQTWLARIYELWSDPSWDPPWGSVVDLDATVEAGLVAGVVKGSAFVVLDSRMKDDARRYALVKLTGGRFLGRLHPQKRRILAPVLRARAARHGHTIQEEDRELRQHNAALALTMTITAPAKRAYAELRKAFFRLLAQDLGEDLSKRREQSLRGPATATDPGQVGPRADITPAWAERVELAATLDVAMRSAGLTTRERQVCQAVAAGRPLADWAAEEGIDAATARGYWSGARLKLRPHLDLR